MPHSTFQKRLNTAMERAGLKQADLVRMASERGAKLGKSQVSQYVSGKVVPRRDVMALLADLLGVTSSWLSGAGPDPAKTSPATEPQPQPTTQGSTTMREFKKSSKLDNVLYDVRGPVVDEAARMEARRRRASSSSTSATPRPSVSRRRTRSSSTCASSSPTARATPTRSGLFSARKAIMQYCQLKQHPQRRTWSTSTRATASRELIQHLHAGPARRRRRGPRARRRTTRCGPPASRSPAATPCTTSATRQTEWYPDLEDMRAKVTYAHQGHRRHQPQQPHGRRSTPREVLEGIVEMAREHQLMIFCRRDLRPPGHGRRGSTSPSPRSRPTCRASRSPACPSRTWSPATACGWMVLSGNKRCMQRLHRWA